MLSDKQTANLTFLLLISASACGHDSQREPRMTEVSCAPGSLNVCICDNGALGEQSCIESGTGYSSCQCAPPQFLDASTVVVDGGPTLDGEVKDFGVVLDASISDTGMGVMADSGTILQDSGAPPTVVQACALTRAP